jgi:hypothetical protein
VLKIIYKKYKFKSDSIILRTSIYLIALILFWIIFPPFYYKIDDVFMLMISGGFGITYEKSPLIYHSNILIGYLSNYLPYFFQIQPYNLLNIFLIVITYIFINELTFRIIKKIALSLTLTFSTLLFLITRPTYTTISGALFCVGILGLINFLKHQKNNYIYISFIFFAMSTLIRDEQSVFMTLLILPLLFQILKLNPKLLFKVSIITLIIITLFQIINRLPYSKSNYDNLSRFASAQYQLTDYGADIYLARFPNLLDENNLTKNDLQLIRNWYFYDTNLIEISKLERMLEQSNWNNYLQVFDLNYQLQSFTEIVTNYPNITLIILLIVLLYFNRAKKIQYFYLFSIMLYILIGFLIGRQLNYIYYPIYVALIFISLTYLKLNKTRLYFLYALSYSIIFIGIIQNLNNKEDINIATNELNTMDNFQIWQIGGGWSLPHAYPLFDTTSWKENIEIISSDWSIYAPKSNYQKLATENRFIEQLISKNGINVAANNYHIPLMEKYCFEHFGSKLEVREINNNIFLKIYNLKCSKSYINLISENLEFDNNGSFLWLTNKKNIVTLNNYSDFITLTTAKFIFKNNPCKNLNLIYIYSEDSKFQISPNNLELQLNLEFTPYEKKNIEIIFPDEITKCINYNGDKRNLRAKLIFQST